MKYGFLIGVIFLLTEISMAKEDNNRSNLYLGIGGNFNFLKSGSLSEQGVIGSSANVGYDFSEDFGIEFRKGTSLSSDGRVLLDDSMALFAKGKYDLIDDFGIDDFEVYILAGYAKTSVSSGLSDVLNKSSIAYGFGVDYKFSTTLSFYTDYTTLSSSVSQINFGVSYFYDNKGIADLPKDAPAVQSFKEKKAEEKLVEELRIKEKLEEKKKKEAEIAKKKEAEEKLKLPTIVKVNLLHKEDTPKPILVYFFELKAKDEFKRMDYEEIISDEKEMLDGEIVSREKKILKPGKMAKFEFNVKFDSKYYAVVAALNDVTKSDDWRHIVKVNAHEVNTINLMLDHTKIMEFSK